MGILLFIIAYVLFLPLTIWCFLIVCFKGGAKGYFHNSAVNFDRFGNQELRTLLNAILIIRDSLFKFGNIGETISSVLGKNQRANTLTKTGECLAWFLDKLDKNHCLKSIQDYEGTELGKVNSITNDNRKLHEAETYIRIWVKNGDVKFPIFLTNKEFLKIQSRTDKNLEDWVD